MDYAVPKSLYNYASRLVLMALFFMYIILDLDHDVKMFLEL